MRALLVCILAIAAFGTANIANADHGTSVGQTVGGHSASAQADVTCQSGQAQESFSASATGSEGDVGGQYSASGSSTGNGAAADTAAWPGDLLAEVSRSGNFNYPPGAAIVSQAQAQATSAVSGPAEAVHGDNCVIL